MDRETAIILLVVVLASFLYGQIDYRTEPWSGMDLKYYRMMADASPSIARDIPRPFAYRVLGPWLAGLWGAANGGFILLTLLSMMATAVLLRAAFIELGATARASTVAVICLVFNKHLFGTGSWDFFQVKDTLSIALMAGGLLAMYRGRDLALGVLLAAGALASELPLLLIPVYAVYSLETGAGRAPGRPLSRRLLGGLSVCLPAVAIFAAVRILVPASGGMDLLEAALHYGAKLRYPRVWFGLLVNPFIPFVLLPLVRFGDTLRFVRSHPHLPVYFFLVLAAAAFGSNNERLMAPSAPAFFALVAFLLDSRPGRPAAVRSIVVAAAVVSSLHHTIARFPLPSRTWTVVLSLAALAAVTLVFVAGSLRERAMKGQI